MTTATAPSAQECLTRINKVLGEDFPKSQDVERFLAKFVTDIGGREVEHNAVNLKWMFAAFDTSLPYPVQVIIEVGYYEDILTAIYAEYPEYAAEAIQLYRKTNGL